MSGMDDVIDDGPRLVQELFHEKAEGAGHPEVTWYPETSEVHGDADINYDYLDLAGMRQDAEDEICRMAEDAEETPEEETP